MKQLNNLWDSLISLENIELAHKVASKKKQHYQEVIWVNNNKKLAFRYIRFILSTGKFKTSKYVRKEIFKGGKNRVIHKLPYFPDRIVQHCITNLCKDFWKSRMIRDTFQSIKGRGTLDCARRVDKYIKENKPKYCLKIDIKKFYPSVKSKSIVDKNIMRIRCKKTKELLNSIILSLDFIPLGNHISQYAGNLLLTDLDWNIKQKLKVKGYFRYCDDLVFMSNSKLELRQIHKYVKDYLNYISLELKQPDIINLNNSYLSFVGYRFSNNKKLIRQSIAKSLKQNKKETSVPSYYGWCKHSGSFTFYKNNKGVS